MTKIIAFEGIDGTGKTVQLQRLYERLTANGRFRVKTLSFPMYDTFFGSECGRLLSGSGGVRANEVDQRSMALWYALDRFEAFRDFDYSDADVLLINRYLLSNAVYQSVRDRDLGNPDLLDFVIELEYNHFRIPKAHAHIVLDMNPENAYENVGKKGYREYVGDQPDIYEALPDIQKRARQKYIEYAQRMPEIHIIPCMEQNRLKSIEAIGELIDQELTFLLG
jgi:dTMP kinase